MNVWTNLDLLFVWIKVDSVGILRVLFLGRFLLRLFLLPAELVDDEARQAQDDKDDRDDDPNEPFLELVLLGSHR